MTLSKAPHCPKSQVLYLQNGNCNSAWDRRSTQGTLALRVLFTFTNMTLFHLTNDVTRGEQLQSPNPSLDENTEAHGSKMTLPRPHNPSPASHNPAEAHGGSWAPFSVPPCSKTNKEAWLGRRKLACLRLYESRIIMAVTLRASNPAGPLGLAGCSLPQGREESNCIPKPAPGGWGHVRIGRGHITSSGFYCMF